MPLREADVWVAGKLVAHIKTRSDGANVFTYTQDTIEAGGPAVAFSLPVSAAPVITPHGALPTFFSNLLPEGRRLSSLKRKAKVSLDDELGLLLEVGSDTIGDVQIVSAGTAPTRANAQIDLNETLDFSSVLASAGIVDPTALPGIQDKASARTIATPISSSKNRDFILKVSPPEFPRLVENEAACLNIARRLGRKLPVAQAKVLHDIHGRSGLLVTRFDRPLPQHVEDAAQLLQLPPALKYSPTMEEVAHAVSTVCASPKVAATRVALITALAWLTGNGDLHAKNISVIKGPRGFEVAPLYDVPSTLAYGDPTMALSVAGAKDNLSAKKFRTFMQEVGISTRAGDDIIRSALSVTSDAIEQICAATEATGRVKRDVERVLQRRRRLFEA